MPIEMGAIGSLDALMRWRDPRLLRTRARASGAVLDRELMLWLDVTRSRLATVAMATSAIGSQEWVAASAGDVTAPTTAASEFTRWMLGGGTRPDPATT